MLTRREWIGTSLVAVAAGCSTNKVQSGWPAAWDRILLEKAAATEAPRFDEKEALVTRLFGPGYRNHTKFRAGRVHDLRASCDYALTLLELRTQNGLARAQQVLNRVCELQNTDPASEWYGLWGYYLEEPPDKMQEADWSWVDVLGGTLLLVAIRHADRLEPGLQARIRAAIGHAALSVKGRYTDPSDTSIAVKGSFVCAAAAQRLGMAELAEYARQRLVSVEALIEESGSFAEYNSPVDARITLTDLTRIRMYLHPGPMRDSAARIESRLWLHLARHWDGFRRQFGGPMSRCYDTDLGEPFWLEKSLGGRLGLADPALRGQYGDLDTAIHDFRCTEQLAASFLKPVGYQHREMFRIEETAQRPVQGVTYVETGYSLGSVNQGDFWVQSRPLLAYFGGPERPARFVRLRVIKDGYDFASALLWTVQANGCVLGLVNFRSPGGDRHPTLDPVPNGEFKCGRVFLELSLEGLREGFSFIQEGNEGRVDGGGIHAELHLRGGRFDSRDLHVEGSSSSRSATFTVDFKSPARSDIVRWATTGEAWAVFTLAISASPLDPRAWPCKVEQNAGAIHAKWDTPAGSLELHGLSKVGTIDEHRNAFGEKINSQDVPIVRL